VNIVHYMKKGDLLPGLAVDDALNLRARNTEGVGQLLQCSVRAQLAYLLNLFRGEFCPTVTGAALHRAVTALICAVIGARAPRQIVEAVVQRVAVQVARLVSIGAGTAECLKHKARRA
jgi:hypothetical protein